MRVVFLGTPAFAVPSLDVLAKAHEVVLVLTRPDAVRGRGRVSEPSPVKAHALELGLSVLDCAKVTPEIVEAVRAVTPDILCVAAFGCILPDALLEAAPHGAVNVHASLLPRWRGAAPIQRAILAGDAELGVSIMRVSHDLDAGPWCVQASTLAGDKDASVLTAELSHLGAEALVSALPAICDGTVTWHDQDEALVTYARKIDKQEMLLDPSEPADVLLRRIRASGNTAPARCVVAGRAVRVCAARLISLTSAGQGEVVVEAGALRLGCASGELEVLRVKPDGKREMDASAWSLGLRGSHLVWGRI